MEHKIIGDIIMLVIAFNLLYNEFKITITPLLHLGNKNLEEIQLIVISMEVINLAKKIIGVIGDLAIIVRKKRPLQ